MLICLLGLCCIILCVNKLLVSLFLGFRQSIGFNPWDENFKLKCFSAINFAMDAGKRICKWEMEIQTYFIIIIIFFSQRVRPLLVVVGDIESEVVGHLMTDSVCTKQG